MGTNYYRIPTVDEMENRKQILIEDVKKLELTPENIESGFCENYDEMFLCKNPWDKFVEETSIHLGKRSGGWLFCWNFHDKKFYSNKDELLKFIREGRVVNEYGEEIEVEEFIDMALNWEIPNGRIYNSEYRKEERKRGMGSFFDNPKYDDIIIDGLRVSNSTDFL